MPQAPTFRTNPSSGHVGRGTSCVSIRSGPTSTAANILVRARPRLSAMRSPYGFTTSVQLSRSRPSPPMTTAIPVSGQPIVHIAQRRIHWEPTRRHSSACPHRPMQVLRVAWRSGTLVNPTHARGRHVPSHRSCRGVARTSRHCYLISQYGESAISVKVFLPVVSSSCRTRSLPVRSQDSAAPWLTDKTLGHPRSCTPAREPPGKQCGAQALNQARPSDDALGLHSRHIAGG
jgi:hypothetical protein